MSNSEHFVTASEYFNAIEKAFTRAYLSDNPDLFNTQKWHPDDLAVHLSVIVESIGSYSSEIINGRR